MEGHFSVGLVNIICISAVLLTITVCIIWVRLRYVVIRNDIRNCSDKEIKYPEWCEMHGWERSTYMLTGEKYRVKYLFKEVEEFVSPKKVEIKIKNRKGQEVDTFFINKALKRVVIQRISDVKGKIQ